MTIQKSDGLWMVPAKIDNYNVVLALDTGSDDVTISEYAATAMELPTANRGYTIHGGLGGSNLDRPVLTQHFAVGGFDMLSQIVTAGKAPINSKISPPLVGLLGRTYLGAFDVEIDFKHSQLALYGSRHCDEGFLPWRSPYHTLTASLRDNQAINLDVLLDGHAIKALLDTGATSTLLTTGGAQDIGLSSDDLKGSRGEKTETSDGHGTWTHAHTFSTLKIGDLVWNAPTIDVQTPNESASLPAGPRSKRQIDRNPEQLILGLDILEQYRIWISFATNQIFLMSNTDNLSPN